MRKGTILFFTIHSCTSLISLHTCKYSTPYCSVSF